MGTTATRSHFTLAAERLARARRMIVFTGAGVSVDSGIPTFRDPGGLWNRFPPEQFAELRGLLRVAMREPARFAEFLVAFIEPVARAAPNPAHRAIAALERHTQVSVVTQNVDGLHQEAGSTIVLEIHGSLLRIVTREGRPLRRLSRDDLGRLVAALGRAGAGRLALPRVLRAARPLFGVSRRGLHRPDIVLFGEALKQPAWDDACADAAKSDVVLVVGTSGLVYPAAELPALAARHGAFVIEIDPHPSGAGDVALAGAAGELVPELVAAAFGDPVA